MRVRPVVLAVAVLLVLALPSRARAHAQAKTIDVVVGARALAITVEYGVAAGADARMLREQHDADHDGRLSGGERRRLGDQLSRRILAHVRFAAGDVTLAPDKIVVEVDGGGGFDTAIRARLRAELPLPRGLRWRDVPRVILAVGGGRDGFAVRVTHARGEGVPELAPTVAQAVPGTPTVFTVTKAAPSRGTRPGRRGR